MCQGNATSPEPCWNLVRKGGTWRLKVAVASRPEVELCTDALRLQLDSGTEPVTLSVPSHAQPVDPAAAKCSFSPRRGELLVEWPCLDGEDTTASEQQEAPQAASDLQEAPQDTPDTPGLSAEEWRLKGNAAVKDGNLDEAVACYTAGLRVPGSDAAMLHSNRAMCLHKLGRFEEALEDARCCVSLRPDFFKGYLRGAMCLRSLEKPEEALAFLKRCPPNDEAGKLAAELRPEADAAQKARICGLEGADRAKEEGNVLFRQGLFEDALAKYTAALELCSSQESDLALALRNNCAACSHQLGDFSAVVRDASFVLERQPLNAKALMRRMLALEPLERYRAALADARTLLQLDPRHEVAGKTQHRLGKLVRDLEREGLRH